MHQEQTAFENIVGKEEMARDEQFLNARDEQFLLFPQCCFSSESENCIPILSVFLTSYLLLNWKSPKLACKVKG